MIRLIPAITPILLSFSILLGSLSAASIPSVSVNRGPQALDTLQDATREIQAVQEIEPPVPSSDEEMRGLWVASVVNIDWPKNATTSAIELKKEALAALDFAQEHRFNAIFLQIRPTADSLFPSAFFPWSKYLTGTVGTPPDEGFDPLAFWIEEAHKRGIALHAWLNPYRITKKESSDPAVSLDQLPGSHPARLHPEWTVFHGENLYFNPGLPEVRALLLNSITEILTRYAVDGIHFDDYFYPDGSATKLTAAPAPNTVARRGHAPDKKGVLVYASPFNDSAAFVQYGAAHASIDDWRRSNVDTFVRDVGQLIRKTAPNVQYGISPFGIWRNKGSDANGSDTNGSESFTSHAADTRKWVREGWIDYIAPQLYWQLGYSIADYDKLSAWWSQVVAGTGVDLYIGQAAYRMDADDVNSAWYGVSELEKQENHNRKNPEWDGSIFFSYQSFLDRPGLAAALKAMRQAQDGLVTQPGGGYVTMLAFANVPGGNPPDSAATAISKSKGLSSGGLLVSRPSASMKTNASNQYFNGASNPDKPLYLNGVPVESRSPEGYFGIYMPLSRGKNTFVFSQEGVYLTRTIWRNKPAATASAPSKMAAIGIPAESAYPQSPLYGQPGETYTLTCTAPIGAKVTVRVGGVTYNMVPATTKEPGAGAYPTTYKFSWVMPKQTGTPRVVDAGAPLYTMTYNGKTYKRSAPSKIGIVMPGAPFYAEMKKPATETYDGMTTSGGTRYLLTLGERDTITGMVGEWVRLGSGLFVRKGSVTAIKEKAAIRAVATNADYVIEAAQDQFTFDTSVRTAVTVLFDGKALRIRVPLATSLMLPALPADSLFSTVTSEPSGSGLQYVFKLKEGARLDGYSLEQTATGYAVPLKRHIKSAPGGPPLLGKTILLDPGHGGTPEKYPDGDTGAIGPLGALWSERSINLSHAYVLKAQLEQLGATVVLTRTGDTPLSLEARLAMSRKLRPDLFISLHADSLDDTADISKVSGFSVWYREPLAADIGGRVLRNVVDNLGVRDRRLNQRNFYVVRGTWTPSILFEAGFVPNITEFSQMLDPVRQNRMMGLIAGAVVEYFAP